MRDRPGLRTAEPGEVAELGDGVEEPGGGGGVPGEEVETVRPSVSLETEGEEEGSLLFEAALDGIDDIPSRSNADSIIFKNR